MKRLNLNIDTLKELYYRQRIPPKKIGIILGCSEGAVINEMHRQGFKFYAKGELHPRQLGKDNPVWKGGKYKDGKGYTRIRVGIKQYRLEHTVVWEKAYGKPLLKGWVIHHLNGIKDDNRIVNLFAMTRGGHSQLEVAENYKKRIRQLERQLMELKNGIQPLSLLLE